ncbi:MAG: HAMP domain-containing protein [Azonexus sp.]|nr:HAMP domain-containing protein [Azonexus sp.]
MIRISFRQGMLIGFAVIVLLLGGVALRSWMLVETLLEQSRRSSEQAIELTAAIQELAERSVDIERSARQYLVVNEPAFRQRFEERLGQSLLLVDRLDRQSADVLSPLLNGWRTVAGALRGSLDKRIGKDELTALLDRLMELNGLLKQAGQHWIERQNAVLLNELEVHRLALGGQIVLALGGAVLTALAMGWWLVWPLRHLEQAISHLGANRFDEPVRLGGPDDLRQVGRRLDWLRQRLADLEADRERALRHVSHELKTPLTALKEGVALIREEVPGPLGESQREIVEILQHNVTALQRQIESLLDLNAAAFGARNLRLEREQPRKVLNKIIKARELHAQSRQVRVAVEAPKSGTALIDAEKLGVVFDNLLSNALDFSPEGGEVRLALEQSKGVLRFTCADQGPGVAEEDRTRIFDPFVQGRRLAPNPRRGSGVGLSIVRELVRAMAGTVAAMPLERGACFVVEIPDGI